MSDGIFYSLEDVQKETLQYFNNDELATKAFINKYALKNSEGHLFEKSPDDMHKRLAKEYARIESKYENPLSEEQIYNVLKDFKYIIPGGSAMAGIGNNLQVTSLSNCFVIGNNADSYGGICMTDQEQVQIMKRRGGVGHDLSHIRPKSTKVNNSALTSTGVVPFMERYSNSTREVAQDGRRGALLLSIDIAHPDAEDFIDVKMETNKVTGANVSVKLSDEFINAAIKGEKFIQKFPVNSDNPVITKEIDAKKLWNKIIKNAWKRAEPGCLFWDTVLRESIPDCYKDFGFETVSTNPCVVGDTLIAVADGRNAVSIKQLTEEGKDIPVYSTNIKTGKTEIKWARNPRLTKQNTEVWKLILDDDSELLATPDHKILMSNLEYKDLKNLKPNESIIPFYSFESNGYRQISRVGAEMKGGNFRNIRQYRLIYDFFNEPVEAKVYAIHHMDCNNHNDSPDNLQKMLHKEHYEFHAKNMRGNKNPYHKMSKTWKFNFASHTKESNPRYSGYTNEQLIEIGKNIFKKEGKLTAKIWSKYAKENDYPQFLGNDFRFKTFNNFANQCRENHKVKSVEFYGYKDVYNITVDDNHNYHIITKSEDDKFITSSGICIKNCGEIVLSKYDACRLTSLNLYSYVNDPFTNKSKFDFELFKSHVIIAQRLMDDLVDLEIEKIEAIIEKVKSDSEDSNIKRTELELWETIRNNNILGRRTGLGITGLGDMVAALGLTYGTDEANKKIEKIQKTLSISAYKSSCIMAKERGSFKIYDYEREVNNPYINRLKKADEELANMLKDYGRRNIACLTIAPVGTGSLLTQTTSGLEPVFMPSYKRRRKVNPNDKDVNISFVDEVGDSWEEYRVFHHKFSTWLEINGYNIEEIKSLNEEELQKIIELSPYYKATTNDIDWVQKVKMQGMMQKWIDHSISVTHNLPENVSVETVSQLYEEAWKSGCKGVTVYREGSRSGVLISNTKKDKEEFKRYHAPKRPKVVDADYYITSAKGKKFAVIVGLLENKPYEIFAFENPPINENCRGKIIKVKRGHYDFVLDEEKRIENIQLASELVEERVHTIWISMLLRQGAHIEHIINVAKKIDDNISSFSSAVRRILSKYIESENQEEGCPECGSKLIMQEGCMHCESCTFSRCN